MPKILSFVIIVLFSVSCFSITPALSQVRSSFNNDFEHVSVSGSFSTWYSNPAGSVLADSTVQTSGKYSARLIRTGDSENKFTVLSVRIPVDFVGKKLTLKANLRTSNVKGSASIFMGQDGPSGSVAYKNMRRNSLKGTHDWETHEISFPLKNESLFLNFGVTLSGTGTMWIDDVEVFVDGIPFAKVPFKAEALTILDQDRKFEEGSGVVFESLNAPAVDRLILLGKVWGFLKYHHPSITSGKYHWDFELFRFLPGYMLLSHDADAQLALVKWVESLGQISSCKPCATAAGNWQLEADLDWITDEKFLGKTLSERLKHIYENRHSEGDQFYVRVNPGARNPLFERELTYDDLDIPDAGYRLLALYRLGSIIAYWSPYRNVIGEKWEDVEREFIPRLLEARNKESYRNELLMMVARINDGHSNLFSAYKMIPPVGTMHPPFAIRFVENEAVVYRLFSEFPEGEIDLEPGDIIESIDGKSVKEMVVEFEVFYGASNQATRMRSMARKFLFGNHLICDLKVKRDGQFHHVSINRIPTKYPELMSQSRHDRPGNSFQKLSPEIAYLKMEGVSRNQVPSYFKSAQGTDGWILDLRGYPPEMLVYPLGGHLVSKETVFAQMTKCDMANPGFFGWIKPLVLAPGKVTYQGKVVILVDEVTQSRAEYHALAFRAASGAVVMGSTTAGADGTVSKVVFPGGDWCYITGKGIFNPDFSPTQRVGITPDIEILPTIEGVRQGRDEVLEAAVRYILDRNITAEEMAEILSIVE